METGREVAISYTISKDVALTTALKSAYRNTAFLSTRATAELRELLDPGGRE
jgi:hypothetical protein